MFGPCPSLSGCVEVEARIAAGPRAKGGARAASRGTRGKHGERCAPVQGDCVRKGIIFFFSLSPITGLVPLAMRTFSNAYLQQKLDGMICFSSVCEPRSLLRRLRRYVKETVFCIRNELSVGNCVGCIESVIVEAEGGEHGGADAAKWEERARRQRFCFRCGLRRPEQVWYT